MDTRLSEILKDRQLDPKQFAISCGVHESVVQKLVLGHGIQTSINTLGKILFHLNCEFFDLFPKEQFRPTAAAIQQRNALAEKRRTEEVLELKKQMTEMQDFMLKQAAIIEKLSRKN